MNEQTFSFSETSTGLGTGLIVGMLMIGTGGGAVAANSRIERSGQRPVAIMKSDLNTKVKENHPVDGGVLDFQKLSLQLMETYGFNVKQYSDIMQVTRATIYKWHDLNTPISKVQSKNANRLKILNESLCGIKENRKHLFASWLRDPLDEDASLVASLLLSQELKSDDLIEQTKKINVGLMAMETSNELDELLGIG